VYKPKIKVVGVGGGGSNIVAEIAKLVGRLDFVAANTDAQALRGIARKNVKTFAFGEKLTQGLGCGMDAVLGETAAQQDKEKLVKLLEGQDLLVLVSSLGGGAGSGAAPVFLQTARELKCLTIGIFTMPFSFEGEKRQQLAFSALEKLKPLVNTYVLIPNDNIFRIIEKNTALHNALSALNKKLAESLQGFIEILSLPGFINIDFADIQSLLEGRDRLSYLASATSSGPDRAAIALEQVAGNPLLDYSSKGAERVLLNIAGGKDLKMSEVAEVSRAISRESPKAKVIFGITLGNALEKKMSITLFALGVQKEEKKSSHTEPPKPKAIAVSRKQKKLPLKQKVLAQAKPLNPVPLAPARGEARPTDVGRQPRRNALELHKAIEEEIEELQEKEKAWDIPAFLRAKKA
jgi:cell division protein FtsZ